MNTLLTKLLSSILVLLLSATNASALGLLLSIDDVVKAELVARVKIISITDAPKDSGYDKLAHATIIDAVKGAENGATVEILSNQSKAKCPYIEYKVGDDCIVVAKHCLGRQFETMNFDAGRFMVKAGRVDIYPLYREQPLKNETDEDIRVEERYGNLQNKTPAEVMAGFRRLLTKFGL